MNEGNGIGTLDSRIQDIIDKVSGGSMSRARANALVGLAGDLAGIQKTRMGIEADKAGLGVIQAGQNLTAETTRRGQDMGFGLGKERLGMEKERYDIGNINAATSLLKPKKEIGGMGSVATSPSSLSTPSFSFSDWWNL